MLHRDERSNLAGKHTNSACMHLLTKPQNTQSKIIRKIYQQVGNFTFFSEKLIQQTAKRSQYE